MKANAIFRTLAVCALALAPLVSTPASALSYVPVADEHLADQAALIVHGRVVSMAVLETANGIMTEYSVAPLEVFKGAGLEGSAGDTVRVRVLGGALPDGRETFIWGMPRFAVGEEALLFLNPHGDDFRIAHMVMGQFRAAEADGVRYWQRSGGDAGHRVTSKASGLADAAARYDSPRLAEAFTRWLADRAAGIVRPADYFADGVATTELRPIGKFTLLTLTPRIRWFEFDTGGEIFWRRHVNGQDGLADRGVDAFRNARLAWNDEPNTPIRIFPAPDTPSMTGFGAFDGQNVILFSDLNDDIEGDFACGSGGVLAIGGPSFIVGGGVRRDWKGNPHAIAVEAEIVVNNGFSCFAQGDPLATEQVYAHELGHTLGLGHSCGDDNSPPCAGRPRLNEALMRATVGRPFFGARLNADDAAGIRWVYDRNFFDERPGDNTGGPNPTCPLQPGDPRFCTDCSPCTSGQGDCDRDSECAPGLVCVDNVGAQFGFAPGIDVCLDETGAPPPPPPPPTTCTEPLGSGRYCAIAACAPCGNGQGDCDSDAECAPGFQCVDNVGAQFGFAPGIDVCLPGGPPPTCMSQNGRGDFCALPGCGPCGAGEGDCDSDAECAPGLRCVDDIGPQFGFGPRTDVCQ